MPEGDTIFRTARALHRALAGQTVTRFSSVFPRLNRIHEDAPITGRIVEKVESIGKWLLVYFSGDLILLTHMLVNGSWHLYRPGERWRKHASNMRVLIETQEIQAVAFSIQVAEFHTLDSLRRREGFRTLGQDVLAEEFDEAQGFTTLRANPTMEIGEALLRQSLLAGIGNVFKSEICFACRINPFTRVAALADEQLSQLVEKSRVFLRMNVAEDSRVQIVTYTSMRRTTGRANPPERLWVYGRGGLPCRVCGTPIEKAKQGDGARVTFWCPSCQGPRP